MLQGWDPTWSVRRFDASAAIDGAGLSVTHPSGVSVVLSRRPDGALLLEALGPTEQVAASSRWPSVQTTLRPGTLLLPGFVNAHTHLDLTHIGPRPHDPQSGFSHWIDMIRRERAVDEPAITASVREGVSRCLAGGTVLVGDIAGAVGGRASSIAGTALAGDGRINAVTFAEFFAIGGPWRARLAAAFLAHRRVQRLRKGVGPDVQSGLSAHAPYSVGLPAYRHCLRHARHVPSCTHLAESRAERELFPGAHGPFRQMLSALGLWDSDVEAAFRASASPVAHLSRVESGPALPGMAAVHCNDVSDEDLATLAAAGARVIYCPRASAYFGADAEFGPHRYGLMMRRGITVALGTDSIVNLDTPARISVWDEMRLLSRRDRADPLTLLQMATTRGADVLGRDSSAFTFGGRVRRGLGTLAGLLAVQVPPENRYPNPDEMLRAALDRGIQGGEDAHPPELLAIGRV